MGARGGRKNAACSPKARAVIVPIVTAAAVAGIFWAGVWFGYREGRRDARYLSDCNEFETQIRCNLCAAKTLGQFGVVVERAWLDYDARNGEDEAIPE